MRGSGESGRESLPLSSEGRGLPRGPPYIETNVQKSALETAAIPPSVSGFKPEMQFFSNFSSELRTRLSLPVKYRFALSIGSCESLHSRSEESKRVIYPTLLTNARDGMEMDFNINGFFAARDLNRMQSSPRPTCTSGRVTSI